MRSKQVRRATTRYVLEVESRHRSAARAMMVIKPLTLSEIRKLGYDYWRRQKMVSNDGHTDDLMYDDGRYRVWVSRMSLEDYDGDRRAFEANKWTIEKLANGKWVKA